LRQPGARSLGRRARDLEGVAGDEALERRPPFALDEGTAQERVGETPLERLAAGRIAHGGNRNDAARAGGPGAEAHEIGGVDDPIGLARDGRHRLRQATQPRGAKPLVENDAGGAAGGRDRDGRRIRAGAGRGRGSGLCLERQQEEELGALPDRARDADLAPHRLDEALADRQPEAGAAEAPRRRLVGLREGGEDRPDLVGRDADAGVADADREAPRLAGRKLDL
jgi:hypothetical protein